MKKFIFSFILIILILPTMVFAFREDIGEPEANIPGEIKEISVEILGIIRWIGYAIAIGMLIYIGVKYVMSAANEKANLKQAVTNYVIGAIIVASVTSILTFTVEMLGGEVGVDDSWEYDEEEAVECEHTYEEAAIVGENGATPEIQFECTKCGNIQKAVN